MYLDPGFGSMVIQIVLAALAAVAAVGFAMKNRIKQWFRKGKPQSDDAALSDDAEQK